MVPIYEVDSLYDKYAFYIWNCWISVFGCTFWIIWYFTIFDPIILGTLLLAWPQFILHLDILLVLKGRLSLQVLGVRVLQIHKWNCVLWILFQLQDSQDVLFSLVGKTRFWSCIFWRDHVLQICSFFILCIYHLLHFPNIHCMHVCSILHSLWLLVEYVRSWNGSDRDHNSDIASHRALQD